MGVIAPGREPRKVMTTTNQASLDASMTRPTLAQQSLVIMGATGMVGGYTLRYALFARLWRKQEHPNLEQKVIEGDPAFSI